MVGWLCLTSHRQRGHLETAPSFTIPCKGRDCPHLESNPGSLPGSALHNHYTTPGT